MCIRQDKNAMQAERGRLRLFKLNKINQGHKIRRMAVL